MPLSKHEWPILLVNLIYVPFFAILAWRSGNHEFLMYVVVIVLVGALVVAVQRRVRFSRSILWGLTCWGLMHMAGGMLHVGDSVLYGLQLVPLVPRHELIRYDHMVHFFGFGVCALIAHHLLRPYLRESASGSPLIGLLVLLMGSGFGAMNEIVEFVAVLWLPKTGVGGYENTLWDLVFNLLGGVAAVTWLAATRELGVPAQSP